MLNRRLLAMLVAGLYVAIGLCAAGQADEPVTMTFDLSATGKTITNKFSDINVWNLNSTWARSAGDWPKDYFAGKYPFVERIQLMCATGGNARRDLFINPEDRSTLTDYNFDSLIKACENIVAHGLKPMIKTGWTPLKFCEQPKISKSFKTNVRPPDDYDAYYAYIKAVAEALVKKFGADEVRSWTWCVGVEYDNRNWFEAADETPETTRQAFFKLYDYTVAAIEDVLGVEHSIVGAHGMAGTGWGLWDMADLIEHCAKGENSRRCGVGTQIDFLSFSYYTKVPGFKGKKFINDVAHLRQKAIEYGLPNLPLGIDEGRVLNGWDGKVIYGREVQHSIQAAGDARLFHLMVDLDVDYFATWQLTTAGIYGGLPLVSANLRNLTYRMVGSSLVDAKLAGQPDDDQKLVDGLAGYDAKTKTLRVLAYNMNLDRDAAGGKAIKFTIKGIHTDDIEGLTVRRWMLDEDHGNWWKPWQADVTKRKMTAESFKISNWTVGLPSALNDPADRAFWNSRLPVYEKASRLEAVDEQVKLNILGGISWRVQLKPNSVVLYEISPVASGVQ